MRILSDSKIEMLRKIECFIVAEMIEERVEIRAIYGDETIASSFVHILNTEKLGEGFMFVLCTAYDILIAGNPPMETHKDHMKFSVTF